MLDLTNFQRGQIVGSRLVGARAGGSVIWAAVSCSHYDMGTSRPIVTLKGRVTREKYREYAYQVHSMMQTFFTTGGGIFLDVIAPINAAKLVQSWFDKHEDEG
ncbi:hypothetical protein TNCV_763681 [Trichonephila clavipes]|nr:hypothetical protein TNCV_763681 [Trichonephila clavipes]